MTDSKKFNEPNITINKVYTKTGDSGETGLVGGQRLSKDNREINPKLTEPAERIQSYYDCKFGEGRYVSKFGAIEPIKSNAAPWN